MSLFFTIKTSNICKYLLSVDESAGKGIETYKFVIFTVAKMLAVIGGFYSMVDERKMVIKLIEYEAKLAEEGRLEECVTISDIIRWIVEQPKIKE